MITLETNRLILRDWEYTDVNDMYEYAKNPKIGFGAGWKPHESIEESKKIIKGFIENNDVWAIYSKDAKKVIGSIGLHRDKLRETDGINAKNLGYVLSEEFWGQGLIAEACREIIFYVFEELEIDVLSVNHFSTNEKSKRVIEKLGFKYEGTIRKAGINPCDGSIYDNVIYSITKEDYFGE